MDINLKDKIHLFDELAIRSLVKQKVAILFGKCLAK